MCHIESAREGRGSDLICIWFQSHRGACFNVLYRLIFSITLPTIYSISRAQAFLIETSLPVQYVYPDRAVINRSLYSDMRMFRSTTIIKHRSDCLENMERNTSCAQSTSYWRSLHNFFQGPVGLQRTPKLFNLQAYCKTRPDKPSMCEQSRKPLNLRLQASIHSSKG